MERSFLVQPNQRLGDLLLAELADDSIQKVIFVSAFASLRAALRVKGRLLALHASGIPVRLVIGIDMGGTSREVLRELAAWPVEVIIYKNSRVGSIFHGKIYLISKSTSAELIVGSNNFTDGGWFTNHEVASRVHYDLPDDEGALASDVAALTRYLDPTPPLGRALDAAYLAELEAIPSIPSAEAAARRNRQQRSQSPGNAASPFGFEPVAPAPPLPAGVVAAIANAIGTAGAPTAPAATVVSGSPATQPSLSGTISSDPLGPRPAVQVPAVSFYLELTVTADGNIPGEQRIPLEAIQMARDFWGWPDEYIPDIRPTTAYWNWRPIWRITDAGSGAMVAEGSVRMYLYENSRDFRFYSGYLARAAEAGDLIRVTRVDLPDRVFDVELARAGTPEHAEWLAYGIMSTGGQSPRRFGFS